MRVLTLGLCTHLLSKHTIEEMDEDEDIESIKKLVNRGLDIGTDSFTDR